MSGHRQIIWVNGPFGGGKTQTAYELARRVPDAVVSDPELIGYGLHRAIPRGRLRRDLGGDFQDFSAWRIGVVEVLDRLASAHPGPIVVPMTLVREDYFAQVMDGLGERGHEVRHFALLAPRDVVLARLRERGLGTGLNGESWALERLDESLATLAQPRFATHLDTATTSVSGIADRIAAECRLEIRPDTDAPWQGRLRRATLGLRHIRLW